MQLRKNREEDTAAVNATRAFFEEAKCIFQSVNLENDYGKDAYVDFTNEDQVTPLCAALQIKGGLSSKTKTGYRLRAKPGHTHLWRNSTVPVIGVIHDPRNGRLYWVDVSDFLQANPDFERGSIPVSHDSTLTRDVILGELAASVTRSGHRIRRHPLIQLYSASVADQKSALSDCLFFAGTDLRYVLAIRAALRFIDATLVLDAMMVLSAAGFSSGAFGFGPHPLSWGDCETIGRRMQWSADELALVLESVDSSEWCRGSRGHEVFLVLRADPDHLKTLQELALHYFEDDEEEMAVLALSLSVENLYLMSEHELADASLKDFVKRNELVQPLGSIQMLLEFIDKGKTGEMFQ